jgi:hypothetical protein
MGSAIINRKGNIVRGWVAVDFKVTQKCAANPFRTRVVGLDLSKKIRANAQNTI